MYMKIYKTEGQIMVAVCDKSLIGRTFQEGELVLRVTEKFYKGISATEDEVSAALARATIANLVGEMTVACAVEGGYVDPELVLVIDGVPHAQMVRI